MNYNREQMEQLWRRQLLNAAKGHVLEVDVGAGDNFKFYPPGVSITATDAGSKAIQQAGKAALINGVKTNFIVSAVEDLQLPQHSFDTIVSTFALSSYEQPLNILKLFSEWCKPGGLILLLEYGLSKNSIVKWGQQKLAPYYYRKTGSHLDLDLISIIASCGLDVRNIEVKYAGVVYLVWAALAINK